MILKRLREATRDQHEALENVLPLGAATADDPLYRAVMSRFWGFYATWEAQAAAHAGAELVPVLKARAKLPLLEADLRALGVAAEGLPRLRPEALPAFSAGDATLLGSMYVVEGATLGGQVISRHLEQDSGFHDGLGYSFFRSYGKAVGQQWRAFTALLETLPDAAEGPAVAAAQQTFAAFAQWFAEGGFGAAALPASPGSVPSASVS